MSVASPAGGEAARFTRNGAMVHHAKVDRWLAVLLGGLALAEFTAAAAVLVGALPTGRPEPAAALGISSVQAGVGALFVLALWGCYRTRYEVTPSHLVIRFGPFRSALPLDDVVEVFPTRNPLSAPAPS